VPIPAAVVFGLAASAVFGTPARAGAPPQQDAPPEECSALAALDFSEALGASVKVTAAHAVAQKALPARCRVSGSIAPETGFEAWLPEDGWNGKLLMTGCFNLCGVIRADQMEDALTRGYATVTTDMGHSEQKYPDTRWAYNNPQLETDFAHRATHLTAVLARELVLAYYGRRAEHAYFRGCSTGGRQALVEAERYPDDFDGIIAGAPFNQALSVPHMFWAERANTGPDGRPILGRAQFAILHKAALAACDGLDGLLDGIIGDPESCPFAPASLTCPDARKEGCLTREQVEAAEQIYEGPPLARSARAPRAGAAVGSEFTWEDKLIGHEGKPSFFHFVTQNWSQYLAYQPDPPPSAAPFTFDFEKDPPRLAATVAFGGYQGALEGFRGRDGKLIIYHGWADESLMPAHTLAFWEEAGRRLGGPAGLASFARLYLLPGVMHCGGGPGAGDVDYLTALEQWVEHGQAPDVLTAVKSRSSTSVLEHQPRFPPVASEILFTRPLYPYPDIARYPGKGDSNDAASFERVRRTEEPRRVPAPAPAGEAVPTTAP
jgi:feruloyl esterase